LLAASPVISGVYGQNAPIYDKKVV
jgi:hypothetical protein